MRCAEAMSVIWHTGHSEENPFPGRMRKNGREAKKAGFFIDVRCLDRRDLMPAKALAHNVQPARQRGIAEGAVRLPGEGGPDGGNERLLWIGQLHLRLGKGSRDGSDCITGAVHGCHPPRSGHQSSRRLILSVWP